MIMSNKMPIIFSASIAKIIRKIYKNFKAKFATILE